MKYVPPLNGGPDGPYVDGHPETGVEGSILPAAAIEHVQREIVNAITAAGLTPSAETLDQLSSAIVALAGSATPTATTTVAGRVELATAAEARAGIDDDRAVTPKGLAAALAARDVGEIAVFARTTPPHGWLKANGAAISRTVYTDLFAAIGITFGAGDGSTTFNIPDLRGEFIRGWDDGRGIDATRVLGSVQGFATEDLYALITGRDYGRAATVITPGWAGATGFDPAALVSSSGTSTLGTPISSLGTGETRPRNIALLACIKY